MEVAVVSLLNGAVYGLLLFLLSSGLTLIFSLMGVLNFAHASFYMLGAYLAYSVSRVFGFWPALIVAPLAVGAFGMAIERFGLRYLHKHGHLSELLFTFGLAYIIEELVQLIWGRSPVNYRIPPELSGPLFSVFDQQFSTYRGFIAMIAISTLAAIFLALSKTKVGLIVQASLTHPETVQTLGHDVPKIQMLVFGGGTALAGFAGVVGGNAFITEPGMATSVGAIVFVCIVVGGMGSLSGAFIACLLLGILQTLAVAIDTDLAQLLSFTTSLPPRGTLLGELARVKISQLGPLLPYLVMILVLLFRPTGLLGKREG